MKIKWKNLITALVIPLAVGGISGFVTQKNMNVFKSLDKPPLTPPEWAFPVIWTILFVLMGISTYIISVSDTEKSLKSSAYLNYAVQLAVNFFWTVIFFAFKKCRTQNRKKRNIFKKCTSKNRNFKRWRTVKSKIMYTGK